MMLANSQLILTAPPDQAKEAASWGLPVAHMAYRIGGGPHLFRSSLPLPLRGGLMAVDDRGFDGRGESTPFCHEVLRECAARGFEGVLLDLEKPPSPLLGKIVSELGELMHKRGWPLYVPEEYASFSEQTRVMISSALSGGSLSQRLTEAAQRYGTARVTLAVERVAEDFFLPSPTGQGIPLTPEELQKRMEERAPSVFFSNELCAHYFTYMSRQNGAHFILFDDGGSIRKKLLVAQRLGITGGILAYPQVKDILSHILE